MDAGTGTMGAAQAGAHGMPGTLGGRVAVWWFLASEIMLFGGLIACYVLYRLGGTGFGSESHHLNVPLAALNTFVLLCSSLTMVQAFAKAEDGRNDLARRYLLATILAGLGFLGIKAIEYTHHIHGGIVPSTGMFWSFYYAMTGLHGLHVLAGIVTNGVLLAGPADRMTRRLEPAGLYWHFVDVVWIFLFPLVYLS
jgi:heme/copper-type cytochrome/quinol oxidase subunit 3